MSTVIRLEPTGELSHENVSVVQSCLSLTKPPRRVVGLGRYSPYRYNIDTEGNRYGHHVISIHKYGDCRKNETTIPERKFLFS